MLEDKPFIALVILFTLLLNVSIFASRQKFSIGGLLIGFIWVILLGLLALASLQTKNMVLRLGTLGLIGFCLAYPYLGTAPIKIGAIGPTIVGRGFADKAKQLTWVSLLASLGLTLGFIFVDESENAKLLAPLDFWLIVVYFFLIR